MAKDGPHIMIVEARLYENLDDELVRGATAAIDAALGSFVKVTTLLSISSV